MTRDPVQSPVRTAIEIAVSLGLIALLLLWCARIIEPFASLIIWGTVIAVALYRPFLALEAALGGSRRLAVAVFVAAGLVIVLVPALLFAETIVANVGTLRGALETGEFRIRAPAEGVREWPLIGERLYAQWLEAATDLEDWLEANHDVLRRIVGSLLAQLAAIGLSVLQFVLATLIAAAMLANAGDAEGATRKFFRRLVGAEQAESMLTLATATIRSVAVGVLGIAFIQAVLGGMGMVAVGVPAAGILALVILVLAIAQLPPWLVLLPVAVYVFSAHSTPVAVIFAVWSIAVSFADMVLKPILLGRGVEAPMPVILIGAIGGMLMSGIIGLFVGAVVLALGYKLFVAWLEADEPQAPAAAAGER